MNQDNSRIRRLSQYKKMARRKPLARLRIRTFPSLTICSHIDNVFPWDGQTGSLLFSSVSYPFSSAFTSPKKPENKEPRATSPETGASPGGRSGCPTRPPINPGTAASSCWSSSSDWPVIGCGGLPGSSGCLWWPSFGRGCGAACRSSRRPN